MVAAAARQVDGAFAVGDDGKRYELKNFDAQKTRKQGARRSARRDEQECAPRPTNARAGYFLFAAKFEAGIPAKWEPILKRQRKDFDALIEMAKLVSVFEKETREKRIECEFLSSMSGLARDFHHRHRAEPIRMDLRTEIRVSQRFANYWQSKKTDA